LSEVSRASMTAFTELVMAGGALDAQYLPNSGA